MLPKPISVKSYADFATGSEAQRRSIINLYKHPSANGKAMATYYAPAKAAIVAFHAKDLDLSGLEAKAKELEKQSLSKSKSARNRALNNARAIRSYIKYFGSTQLQKLPGGKCSFNIMAVQINMTPDLHCLDPLGKELFIKFSFAEKKLKPEYVRALVSCMSYGLHSALEKDPSSIAFIDVPSGTVHKGVTITDALVSDLVVNCDELVTAWGSAP